MKIFKWIIFVLILIIVLMIIYFAIPYSPLKSNFKSLVNNALKENNKKYANLEKEVYTENDIKNLPIPVQKFFRYSNLIGKPKIYNAHIIYEQTDFKLSPDKPMLKIKYEHYNFLNNLDRIASINAKMMMIPFEGLDNYSNGKGSMKGMIAKSITLFNVTGYEMNVSSLVTCLSEMVFLPTIALQDYVTWESIDDNTAKATINYNSNTASGIFKFNDDGAIVSFETNDRYMDERNGKSSKQKWLVKLSNYVEENNIKHPSNAKAIWKLEKEDYVYFDGKVINIDYNVK